ncbi:MAG TPA: TIGR04255 family protein [Sedimentisphaerales bacterium]|nr:TIGR04255 family protein [Sedimentisphaerales bacterium]
MGNKYKTNYLDKVIARIDFATPLPRMAEAQPGEVAELAIKSFPIAEPKKVMMGQIKFKPTGEISAESSMVANQWNYHGKSREKTLCITQDFVFVVYNKYETFEKLKADFVAIIEKLFEVYEKDKAIVIKRFGLRYINNIKLQEDNPMDWSKYLNSTILQMFAAANDKTNICRALNTIVLNYGDILLKFQYGMNNPDYPALIRSKEFILDYDAFYEGSQDKDSIIENLERFHNKIEEFFEKCITDELRKEMNT